MNPQAFLRSVLTVPAILLFSVATTTAAEELEPPIDWRTDYAATMTAAQRDRTPMVVYFHDETSEACRRFEADVLSVPAVHRRLAVCRCVRLPIDAEIISGGQSLRLLDHPTFAGLEQHAGLAVLNFTTDDPAKSGRIMKALPVTIDSRPIESDFAFLPSPPVDPPRPGKPIRWMADYSDAVAQAENEKRMLLIYFHGADDEAAGRRFEAETLAGDEVRSRLSNYVCLRLPVEASVTLDGADTVLLKHKSFAEMLGTPGVAVVDYSDPEAEYYGQVVSTFPFMRGKAYEPWQMQVILDLPPGKLTQRTLIYAVRTHPERPRSASGELDLYLISEAQSHSELQARIRRQGHHFWETRFHRINRRLPLGLLATEVCAESWPGEGLLEAAIECVRCWRLSSGHWRSVNAAHPVFGYDMRRGSNGIWYATGIFGKRTR